MKQRFIAAALFGTGAVIAAMQASGIPSDSQGWLGLGLVFLTAAYGKFSSNTTLVSPNRPQWTDEQRVAAGK